MPGRAVRPAGRQPTARLPSRCARPDVHREPQQAQDRCTLCRAPQVKSRGAPQPGSSAREHGRGYRPLSAARRLWPAVDDWSKPIATPAGFVLARMFRYGAARTGTRRH